jgi:hypothetical protein
LLNPHDTNVQIPGGFAAPMASSEQSGGLVIDDQWCAMQLSRHWKWLCALDESPQAFLRWLQPRYNPRLGYYFESLVEYWLLHAYPRLISHVQVEDEQRTVGEFDFLIVDSTVNTIQHWEVAVKFYLQYREKDGSVTWYGPNPRDRLDKKIHRLLDHQITLSLQPAAKLKLNQLGLPTSPVSPHLLVKGYLFYPSAQWPVAQASQALLSPRHLRGWWTYVDPFQIPDSGPNCRWLYLPRLQWLAPAKIAAATQEQLIPHLMTYKELHDFCFDLCERNQKPPLIAAMRFTDEGYWQEVSRGFVVPRHWPGFAAKQ